MENREKMKQKLKCPLCFGIVTNPITCPRCSVFICKNCLKDFYIIKKKHIVLLVKKYKDSMNIIQFL